MRKTFDLDAFQNRKNQKYDSLQAELIETKNLREECLLLTNFMESNVKDVLELEIESNQARNIPRDRVLDILEEFELLKPSMVKDIRKFQKIRDVVAHEVVKAKVEKRIIELLNDMDTVKVLADYDGVYQRATSLSERVFIAYLYVDVAIGLAFNKALIRPKS